MNQTTVIPPEKVARKLVEVRNVWDAEKVKQFEAEPRLVELMWSIQWYSMQPGGVQKLTDGLLATYSERFVTEIMQKTGAPRGGRYSRAECLEVWWEFRDCDAFRWPPEEHPGLENFGQWYAFVTRGIGGKADALLGKGLTPDAIREGLEHFNWPFFKEYCEESARLCLTKYLRDLCIDYSIEFRGPWYCPSLIETLFDYMDRHAKEAKQRIAMTEVSRKVYDAFDYAWSARKFVRLDGESRFGKTVSVAAYCEAHPGRFRMVTVPSSNAETDLIRAVGLAFGSESPLGGSGQGLRVKVEYILRHGGIGLAFDEGHYLWPSRYNASTSPGRINWVRAEVVDQGLPCVLVTTPQSYNGQRDRFLKLTGYNMDQFEGRINRRVPLPTTLGTEDCLSVARNHCPEFSDSALKLVVGAALLSASYLKAVEDISALASWLANRRGESTVTLSDVKAAIIEVVPSCADLVSGQTPQVSDPVQLEGETEEARPRVRRKSPAEVVQELRPGLARENLRPGSDANERGLMQNRAPALAPV